MTNSHDLKSAGLKATAPRLKIINLFETSKVRHLTAEDVYNRTTVGDGQEIPVSGDVDSLMVIVGFLPYLYIFASAWKAGKRLSALSGWFITVMAIVCSVVPTDEIGNVWLFEGKLAAGTIAVIVSGWLVYRRRGHIIKVLS